MRKIDIQINQAKLLSFQVELNEEKPEVSASIGLYAGDKKVSSFSLRTQTYYAESIVFEIPLELMVTIKEMAQELEKILIRECNKQLKQLPAPKE